MGEEQQVTGPDLRAGIPLESLEAERPLSGHVDGEAVLLYRTGDEISAIGATCTHYGGPLSEGLIADGRVRCPWHHACFSLSTGEALAAPALNDLPQWRTEVVDGRVHVRDRIERDELDARGRNAAGPSSVVIIGAGAAGSAAAEMLRREGYQGRVTMVDPDPDAPYDRPNLSKDYLAGKAPEEWIPLRPDGFYEQHGVERVVATATALDVARRTVALSNGGSLPFDALLLAPGAAPVTPPIDGVARPHVHVLRSLEDSRRLIAAASSARNVVVAGASFIGMEAAASLRARGVDITVVAPEAVPFAKTLGEGLGAMLRQEHESNGIQFRLGRMLREIREADVVLDDGSVLPADVVLLGVGVRPLLNIAVEAGLAEAKENGVTVDAFLETRAPGVFAAGDIARHPDPRTGEMIRIEHWVVAQRQGQTAARNILGRHERFAFVPFFWTNQFDVGIRYVGHAVDWDSVRVNGDIDARDCTIEYVKRGEVAAVATVGRDRAALEAEAALESTAAGTTGGVHANIR